MVKDLEDGSKAVGLFNRGEFPTQVAARWDQVSVNGQQQVRDLWRQKNLGAASSQFAAEVPRHGAVLIKIAPFTKQP